MTRRFLTAMSLQCTVATLGVAGMVVLMFAYDSPVLALAWISATVAITVTLYRPLSKWVHG